jgi:hypothetical protein
MINGRCECGRIRYEVDADITDLSHCHCSQCRRLHGAAYATFGGISRNKFRYVSGESDRFFCAVCGSNILVGYKPEPETLYLCMGTVDGHPPSPPAYHQFVGSKAAWHEITDDLEQHDAWPPD